MIEKIYQKLESVFQVDFRYITKNSFFLLVAALIGILVRLGRSVAFANLTSKEVYGQYGFVVATLAILTIFSLPGMGIAYVQAYGRGENIYRAAIGEKIKWSLLGTLSSFILAAYFGRNSPALSAAFILGGILFIPYAAFNIFESFYQARKSFKELSINLGAVNIFVTLLTIGAIYLFGEFLPIFITYLLAVAIINSFLVGRTLRKSKNEVKRRESISFGRHLSLMKAVALAGEHLDKILVGMILGFDKLAVFGIAWLASMQVKGVFEISNIIILPKLSALPEEEARRKIKKAFGYLIPLFIIAGLVLAILMPPLVRFFYPRYLESAGYAQALVLGVALGFPGLTLATLLQSQMKKRQLYYFNVFVPLSAIFLTLVLIRPYGLWGVVGARLFSWVAAGAFIYYLAFKRKP